MLTGGDASCFVDGAQPVGQMPFDARAIGFDIPMASGRKWLREPRGAALLHGQRAALE